MGPPEKADLRPIVELKEYPADDSGRFVPIVVGMENIDVVGERGNWACSRRSIGICGTGGGGVALGAATRRDCAVTVRSSSLSPPKSSSDECVPSNSSSQFSTGGLPSANSSSQFSTTDWDVLMRGGLGELCALSSKSSSQFSVLADLEGPGLNGDCFFCERGDSLF